MNLLPAAVSRLAAHPNIIGMKESGGDIAQIADLVAGTPDDFQVLAGSASTFYAALGAGCAGGILALGVRPAGGLRAALFELAKAGRHDEARALQRQLVPLARLLGPTYGVPGLKAALTLVGCDVGVPRAPLLAPASDAAFTALREALRPVRGGFGVRMANLLPDNERILLGPGPSLRRRASCARWRRRRSAISIR